MAFQSIKIKCFLWEILNIIIIITIFSKILKIISKNKAEAGLVFVQEIKTFHFSLEQTRPAPLYSSVNAIYLKILIVMMVAAIF